ncbi:MAG: ABC transporter ATP-binding protein [Chloroflexi bacterium]|nr:ABC transporter ATP-binding protein [Chloroflexota bacterium]
MTIREGLQHGKENGLAVEHLVKRFGPLVAVDDVSFSVAPGEFFSLLGPSGSGKTTTLRIIGGLTVPDEGEVYLGGERITYWPPEKRDVNIVFQNYALFPHLTVFENVAFGPRRRGWPERKIREEVTRFLKMVHLEGYEGKYPRQLSGGEKQRVALIRALIMHPKVLLLDEPLGALDLKIRQELQLELIRIQEEVGITFIYVTHDQGEALTMADRIAVMNRGKILQIGDPKTIYEQPVNRFVAHFIGNTNFFEGQVVKVEGGMALVDVPGLAQIWGVPVGEVRAGLPASVSVRPEKMYISRHPPKGGSFNVLQGIVEDMIYTGVSTEFIVRLPTGQQVRVFAQNISKDAEIWKITWDEKVWVYWRPDRSLVFVE